MRSVVMITLKNPLLWCLRNFCHCDYGICEWLHLGTFFKFPCIARIHAWFFRHCGNHHSDSRANHLISCAQSRKWACLSYWIREVTWPTTHYLDHIPTGVVASKIIYENLGSWDKKGLITSTKHLPVARIVLLPTMRMLSKGKMPTLYETIKTSIPVLYNYTYIHATHMVMFYVCLCTYINIFIYRCCLIKH